MRRAFPFSILVRAQGTIAASIVVVPVTGLLLIAPAAAHDAIDPPRPLGDVSQWFRGDNYPPAAIRAGQEGNVSVILSISAEGLVAGCKVTESSAIPSLDAKTCMLATRRGRFAPAELGGRNVAATYELRNVQWRINDMSVAVSPLEASSASGLTDVPASAASVQGPSGKATSTPDNAAVMQRALGTLAELFKGLGEGISGQEIPATMPVTPPRMALARKVMTELGLTDGFKPLAEMHYQHVLPALQQESVNLPAAKRQMLFDAMRHAIDTAMAQRATAALDDGARYFAARSSDDDLALMADFYASEVGRQSLHPADQTLENKQAAGRFVFDHPGAVRFEKLIAGYSGHEFKNRQASSTAYATAFQRQFCHNLAKSGLVLPSCRSRVSPAIPYTGASHKRGTDIR